MMMLSRSVLLPRFGSRVVSRFMSSLQTEFEDAKKSVGTLKEDPGNEAKLKMYALFKQGSVGKVNTKRPGMMDFVGRAKWDAWNTLGEMTKEDAMKEYVKFVGSLVKVQAAPAETSSKDGASYTCLDVSKVNGLCTIKFNRPQKYNAITPEMYREIMAALKDAAEDNSVHVAVTTGAGKYYCSGNDLSNFMVDPKDIPKLAKDAGVLLEDYVRSFIDFPKPLIALINGPAVGISVTVLGLYDAVYCTDKATFYTPFSSLGQGPEGCSTMTFPKIMGIAKACEMLMFNRKLSAEEALELGIVSRVFPDATFEQETKKLVQEYAELPIQSMMQAKRLVRDPMKQSLHQVNKAECVNLVERWQSEECANAVIKFLSRKSKL